MTIRTEKSIWINRPVSDVFAFMANPDNLTKYVPGITKAEVVSEGDLGVGTQIAFSVTVLGNSMDITAEWTSYDPDVSFTSKNIKGIASSQTTTFKEEDGGTRIARVQELETEGFLSTLASPLIRRNTASNMTEEFDTLKKILEG